MNIAFLTARIPYPLDAGGRIRTFHLLKQISREHRVTLVSAICGREEREAAEALQRSLPAIAVSAAVLPARRSTRRFVRLLRSAVDAVPYTWSGYRHAELLMHVRAVLG